MKGVHFGSNGIILNGHCLIEDCFDSPNTVLSSVRAAVPVSQGVIVISSKRLNGRIGIKQNSVISGAIVDETGENGIAAVYRLLLVPAGKYVFRLPQRTDAWELNQELNLDTFEVEHTLIGPSTIGLASPTPHYTAPVVPWDVQQVSSTKYLNDCQQLLSDLNSARRQKECDLTKKQPVCQSRLPVRDPDQSSTLTSERKISPAARMCALFALLAVSSFFTIPETSWAKLRQWGNNKTALIASGKSSLAFAGKAKGSSGSETAPFFLPGGSRTGAIPVGSKSNSPVPLYYSSYGAGSLDSAREAEADDSIPTQSFLNPAESSSPSESAVSSLTDTETALAGSFDKADRIRDNVSVWTAKVRNNPNDASARKYLAYALLYNGSPKESVKQFKALMYLRPLDPNELQSYKDALALRAVPTP